MGEFYTGDAYIIYSVSVSIEWKASLIITLQVDIGSFFVHTQCHLFIWDVCVCVGGGGGGGGIGGYDSFPHSQIFQVFVNNIKPVKFGIY